MTLVRNMPRRAIDVAPGRTCSAWWGCFSDTGPEFRLRDEFRDPLQRAGEPGLDGRGTFPGETTVNMGNLTVQGNLNQ